MSTKSKKQSRLTKALLETAKDMRDAEIMSQDAYNKITMRHLGGKEESEINQLTDKVTGKEVQLMRKRARMSQAVFARHLNVTPGYVSKLERGETRPKGSIIVLLNLIKRKGIDAIL
jgi:putative transcriptional regulator